MRDTVGYLSKISKESMKRRNGGRRNLSFNAQLDRIDFMLVFCTNVFALLWSFYHETKCNGLVGAPSGLGPNRLNYVSKCSGSETFSCYQDWLLVVFYVFLHSFLCLRPSPLSSLISLSSSSLNLSRVSYVKWKLARATCQILSKYFTAVFNPI